MSKIKTLFNIDLFDEDIEFLKDNGHKISTIVRKIVHDHVLYKRIKKGEIIE